jgi:MoaA/NifB/PqqE/SkfB family radical SAM enzyme
MTLTEAQTIFDPNFLRQIDSVLINGNFGDIVMCADAPDIIDYFRSTNPDIKIAISTNGGARNQDFWRRLAHAGCEVFFCIDGLEDTHSIYRRNTSYNTIIKNAQTFMQSGGIAKWKFIIFDHNRHQIEAARALAEKMGFTRFVPITTPRYNGPVFGSNQQMVFFMGHRDTSQNYDFDHMLALSQKPLSWKQMPVPSGKPIECRVQKEKSIYINSIGEVYPCCWIGFNPLTFNRSRPWSLINQQIADLVVENNALEHGIEHALQWFGKVADSWQKPDFHSGLLQICSTVCSRSKDETQPN